MDSLPVDKKTMIHVAVEAIIVIGIAVWLNSKITNKDDIIARLEKENKELTERVKKIEEFLAKVTGGNGPVPPQPQQRRKKAPSPTTSIEQESVVDDSDEDIEV